VYSTGGLPFHVLFKDRSHTSLPSIAFSSISVFKSKGNPIPSFYTTSNQERLDSRSWAILIRIPRIDLDVDLDRWKALADSEKLRNGKIHKMKEVASVLRRANVAKPLRVSALLTSQRTGGTSECKPL